MRCEIIGVGTELLMGQTTNTNARDIARELSALGVGVYYQTVVGDNAERLETVFKQALDRTDLVILTGGLGPTEDDLTRETVARALNLPLEKDESWERHLEAFFRKRQRPMSEINRRQAMVPKGAELLPNDRGTAPGIYLEAWGKVVVLLPGPPGELLPMFRSQVVPRLQARLQAAGDLAVLRSRTLRVIGMGESALVSELKEILACQSNPTIAPLAKGAEVHLRITAHAPTAPEAESLIARTAAEIKAVLGDAVYGEDDEDLEAAVAQKLWAKKLTLALAESCSGGYLSHRLTNIAGSSLFFKAGLVTYSNEAKEQILGVDPRLLQRHGAVSQEVARAMAQRARLVCKTDLGLSITGIAGPKGGTAEKPVGLTYIALDAEAGVFCRRYEFWGSRLDIKERASQTALFLLWLFLLGKLKLQT